MAAALPQIHTHLMMCYHAIFGLGTLLVIDPSRTLPALLHEWQLFERGHFGDGRAIRTLADFADAANYEHVLGLFRTHDFLAEYVVGTVADDSSTARAPPHCKPSTA